MKTRLLCMPCLCADIFDAMGESLPGGATATHRIYHTPEGDRCFKPDSWQGGVFARYRLMESDCTAMHEGSRIASETLGHLGGF